jgi:glycosyltransferase involved in cell wall biosynthesis
MRVLFYLDRVMHYHVATFRELERRLEGEGGQFILVAGHNRRSDKGRIGMSEPIVRRQLFISYYERTLRTYTFRWQPKLASVVRRIKPDLLIVAGHIGDLTYWRLGLSGKFKYVTWQCGYEYHPGPIKNILTKKFLRQYDHHLAYHTSAKNYLLSHGVSESRITVIHNTINEREVGILPRQHARRIVSAELGIPDDRPIVLFVGAILAEKRLENLLDAVRRLGPLLASVVIVGDGPALDTLKSASTDLDYVRYPGRAVADVSRFFDAADIFVLPGTGGLAINEAMAHGLPIISGYADGSATDLVTDGVNGYILKTGHAEEIAMYLRVLLNDREARLQMGEASRKRITTKYSFSAFIDRIMSGLHTATTSARH